MRHHLLGEKTYSIKPFVDAASSGRVDSRLRGNDKAGFLLPTFAGTSLVGMACLHSHANVLYSLPS